MKNKTLPALLLSVLILALAAFPALAQEPWPNAAATWPTSPQWEHRGKLQPGQHIVQRHADQALAVVDQAGQVIVDFGRWDDYGRLSQGRIAVAKNGRWGFVDESYALVIPVVHHQAEENQEPYFEGDFAKVSDGESQFYIDRAGGRVTPLVHSISYHSTQDGVGIFRWAKRAGEEELFGAIRLSSGQVLAGPQWHSLSYLGAGRFWVGEQREDYSYAYAQLSGDSLAELNLDTQMLIPAGHNLFWVDEYRAVPLVVHSSDPSLNKTNVSLPFYGLINAEREVLIPKILEKNTPGLGPPVYRDGYCLAQIAGDKWATGSDRSDAYTSSDGPWGVLDREGKWLLRPVHDSISYHGYGRFLVRDGNQATLTNPAGDVLYSYGKASRPESFNRLEYACSSWAEQGILQAQKLDLCPHTHRGFYLAAITRQEFCELVEILCGVAGRPLPPSPAEHVFADTDSRAVDRAFLAGIAKGRTGGQTFDPWAAITRQEAAALLGRAADWLKLTAKPDPNFAYADQAQIGQWAWEPVAMLRSLGVMEGVGGNRFSPHAPYTKEQSLLTMVRLLEAYQQ